MSCFLDRDWLFPQTVFAGSFLIVLRRGEMNCKLWREIFLEAFIQLLLPEWLLIEKIEVTVSTPSHADG
jgi:hypothetical protein